VHGRMCCVGLRWHELLPTDRSPFSGRFRRCCPC
jgi:hypothetical protein